MPSAVARTPDRAGWRDLTPSASSLFVVAAVAWIGVVALARDMDPMSGTMGYGFFAFAAVWALMMVAMMLPSVAPFAALYTRSFTNRRGRRMVAFVGGYVVVWSAAAVPAFALGWAADRLVSDHPLGAHALAVAIFAVCGIYQLTPLKDRCLARCRSPLGFMVKYGNGRGPVHDLEVGLRHGAFCLACCWALMLVLVAFGLMNMGALVALAAVVLAEKQWRWGARFGRVVGIVALVLAALVVVWPGLAPGLHYAVAPTMGGM